MHYGKWMPRISCGKENVIAADVSGNCLNRNTEENVLLPNFLS